MKLHHMLYATAGAIAGLLAVLLPLWLRKRLKRRRKAQELYHDAVEQQARERRKPKGSRYE